MDEEFARFEDMLAASAAGIGEMYFQLPVAGIEDSIYRERVYCYELYHQLRTAWEGFDFSLGGEVDKRRHPVFRGGPYAQAKPDLLVHRPGDMERNLACVEVKPCVRPWDEFRDDLKKLTWFCRNARYHRGLFLVYGVEERETEARDLLKGKLRRAADDPEVEMNRIILMHHRAVEQRAERLNI